VKASEEDFRATNLAICEKLFSDKEFVTIKDFLSMQDKFREDLWHYQFHTFEPNDEGRISTESFLKSNLPSLTGSSIEKYKKQIRKINKQLGEKDPGVTLGEFIAFQYFFDKLDGVKAKCAQYRYLDYNTFLDLVEGFVNSEPYCKEHKVQMSEHIAKSIFLLLDTDESGELEPQEIMMFDRRVMGQSREIKAKQDAQAMFNQFMKILMQVPEQIMSFF